MILGPQKRDPFKINGVVIGIVIDNKDPEGHYRVKVKYPWVLEAGDFTDAPDDEDFRSTWCRLTTLFSGGKDTSRSRGAFFLPEVDDEVLLAFEHGDLRRPYVIGALWNGIDKPIDNNDSQGGKNVFRSIISRSGHVIQFVDGDDSGREDIIVQTYMDIDNGGSGDATRKDPHQRTGHFIRLTHGGDKGERIEIYDTSKKNWIYIHTDENMIEINSEKDIHIKAKEKIHMECTDLIIEASNNIKSKANSNQEHEAGSTMKLKAGPLIEQKAGKITLN